MFGKKIKGTVFGNSEKKLKFKEQIINFVLVFVADKKYFEVSSLKIRLVRFKILKKLL